MAQGQIMSRENLLPARYPEQPFSAVFSHDGKELFVARRNCIVDRFSVSSGKRIETIRLFSHLHYSFSLCATVWKGKSVLFVVRAPTPWTRDYIGHFYDVNAKKSVQQLILRTKPSLSCSVAPQPDGSVVVAYHSITHIYRARASTKRIRNCAITSPHRILS